MKIEIRSGSVTLEGYVNAVDRDSRTLGAPGGKMFVERVVPGTFRKAIERAANVELRYNHERQIGGTASGNMELYEDNVGLKVKAVVTDAMVIEKAKNGELRGWSFGFRAIKDRWEDDSDISRRYLEDIYLKEVSILDKTPAYIGTSVEYRDDEALIMEFRMRSDENNKVIILEPQKKQEYSTELSIQRHRKMKNRRK